MESQEARCVAKFAAEFKTKFGREPELQGIDSMLDGFMVSKEIKFIEESFKHRNYASLWNCRQKIREMWKEQTIKDIHECISTKRMAEAEKKCNMLHAEGMWTNDEYIKFFNEHVQPVIDNLKKEALEHDRKSATETETTEKGPVLESQPGKKRRKKRTEVSGPSEDK